MEHKQPIDFKVQPAQWNGRVEPWLWLYAALLSVTQIVVVGGLQCPRRLQPNQTDPRSAPLLALQPISHPPTRTYFSQPRPLIETHPEQVKHDLWAHSQKSRTFVAYLGSCGHAPGAHVMLP
jgi:energy-converting hydrogenase Eha subunit F